jgi:hypothetical protein
MARTVGGTTLPRTHALRSPRSARKAGSAPCRSAIAALWAEDGVFTDPHGRYVGYAALNDAVSQLHAKFPGFVFTPIGAPQAFYDVGRHAWGHGPVGEPPKIVGLDVAIVRDDRIVALYAFIDTPGI